MDRNLRMVLARRVQQFMEGDPTLDTQTKLGAASGVAQSTIGRVLRGDVAVTLDVVQSIADAMSVSAVDLLTDDELEPHSLAADMLLRTIGRMRIEDAQKVLDYARFLAAQSMPHQQSRRSSSRELNGAHEGSLPSSEAAGIWRQARSELRQTDGEKMELDSTYAEPAARQRRAPRRRPPA